MAMPLKLFQFFYLNVENVKNRKFESQSNSLKTVILPFLFSFVCSTILELQESKSYQIRINLSFTCRRLLQNKNYTALTPP